MPASILSETDKIQLQSIDLKTADPDSLKDIQDVTIHTELPKKERIQDYIRQIGNPYCYRSGKYIVKTSFANTDLTLEERLLCYFRYKEPPYGTDS